MTVQQYATRIIKLSRFCPYIVPDEVKKARMFDRNFRIDIYRQVAVLRIQDFADLVDRAIIVEESLPRETKTQSHKKRTAPSSFQAGPIRGPWKGSRSGRGQRQMVEHGGFQSGQFPTICPRYGRRHPSECWLEENVCYHCGRLGHMAQSCQMPPGYVLAPRPFRGGY
ncbi:uncharacterized protein LOC131162700 [Malania oleifera]|uniref:uncharacterized protein LOC131162700 n=1 Tax=Malania oleifera TaxID=397392 RepID=UPI0025AE081E|nr:uncharacterized protein LOC131162700 [Malania oleifera]